MPPTTVHFNGGVNLADTETVMREIASRVPRGVRRIPDGETGDRQNWIWFQLDKFLQTPGLEPDKPADLAVESAEYVQMPKVRLTVDAGDIEWPNLGYADVYQDSFAIFDRLQGDGVIPPGVRFQVEYPTPLASINAWLVEEDQDRLEPSYETARCSRISTVCSTPCRMTESRCNGTWPSSSACSSRRSPVPRAWMR